MQNGSTESTGRIDGPDAKDHRRENANAADNGRNHEGDLQDPQIFRAGIQGAALISDVGAALLGIDQQRATLYRAARLDLKTKLINVAFYADCMSSDIKAIVALLEKVDDYEERKKNDTKKMSGSGMSGNADLQGAEPDGKFPNQEILL